DRVRVVGERAVEVGHRQVHRADRGRGRDRHVFTTKSNCAVQVAPARLRGSSSLGSKIGSLLLPGWSGKYSWVVSSGPPGGLTFTWMCGVRPGYWPGITVWTR